MRRSHVTSLAVLLLGTLIGALAWVRFGQRTGPLESLTKEELYRRAQERDIPGRSSMSKDELIKALRSG